MFTLANEPQGIGKTIDSGFKLFFASFKNVILLALIIGALNVVPQFLMPSAMEGDPEALANLGTTMMIALLVIGVLSLILTAAMIAKVGAVAKGSSMSLGAALGRGLKAFLPMLLGTILYGLAVAIGSVLLLIPGIILMLSLIFYSYLIVLEGDGPIAALKTSHNLVWGNWWRTAVLLTIVFIIVYVLLLGLTIPISAALPVIMPMGEDPMTFMYAFNVFYGLVYAIITPLMVALFIVVYYDLKARKGGADLAARIEATA